MRNVFIVKLKSVYVYVYRYTRVQPVLLFIVRMNIFMDNPLKNKTEVAYISRTQILEISDANVQRPRRGRGVLKFGL